MKAAVELNFCSVVIRIERICRNTVLDGEVGFVDSLDRHSKFFLLLLYPSHIIDKTDNIHYPKNSMMILRSERTRMVSFEN